MLVLTSVNGVDAFVALLADRGRDLRAIHPDARIVAIGPATAARLAAAGLRADLVPEQFVAEGILAALADDDLTGVPVLVARARGARPTLIEGLADRGARVDELELYDALADEPDESQIQRALEADFVTFTASSTVTRFIGIVGADRASGMTGRAISIGPVTSATLRDASIPVCAEADPYTIPGLVDAVLRAADGETR